MSTTEWILLGTTLFACWRWANARLECQGIYERATEELWQLRSAHHLSAPNADPAADMRIVTTLSRVLRISR